MWSYEIVFEHPAKRKKAQMTTTEVVASESDLLVLDYVKKKLQEFEDYELVGIVRRHPIVHILKRTE